MTRYTLNGLELEVPETIQTPLIRKMLEKGWYEIEEVKAINANLKNTDTVLELGSGIGYLAAVCAQICGPERVTTVEANPTLIPIINKNLADLDFSDVAVLHGVIVERSVGETENFYVSDAFWSSSRKQPSKTNDKKIVLPTISLQQAIELSHPTVLIADVEGAEEDFFFAKLPEELRLVIIELHPDKYPPSTIKALFLRLFDQGFVYEPLGSHGAVVVFKRIAQES